MRQDSTTPHRKHETPCEPCPSSKAGRSEDTHDGSDKLPQLSKVDINSKAEANHPKPRAVSANLAKAEKIVPQLKENHLSGIPPHIYRPTAKALISNINSSRLSSSAQFPSQPSQAPLSSGADRVHNNTPTFKFHSALPFSHQSGSGNIQAQTRSNTQTSRMNSGGDQWKGKGKARVGELDTHGARATMGGVTTSQAATQQLPKRTMASDMGSSSQASKPYIATQADVAKTFPSYKHPDNRSRNAAGNSKQLNSGQRVINQQFTRFQQFNKHNQVEKSPFIPKTAKDLQAHNNEYKQWENDEGVKVLNNRIAQKTAEDRTRIKIEPVFGGKKFSNNLSTVLGHKTIYTPSTVSNMELSEKDRAKAKGLEVQWPSLQERKYYGEKMNAEGYARELPPPRYDYFSQRHICWLVDQGVDPNKVVNLDSNGERKDVPWKFRRICQQNGLDEVDFERNEILRAKNAADAKNGLPFDSETAFRGMTPGARREWEQWIEADRVRKKWEAEMTTKDPDFKAPIRVFEVPDPAVDIVKEEAMRTMGDAMMAALDP